MIDPNFILIDLRLQWTAFAAYVEGWQFSDILNWLARYGMVGSFESNGLVTHMFRSVSGMESSFYLDEDEGLIIPRYRAGPEQVRVNQTKDKL